MAGARRPGRVPAPGRPFRAESWVDGDSAHVLVLAPGPASVLALGLSHDAGGNLWTERRGLLPARDLDAPRGAILAALAARPAGRLAATRFGVHAGLAEMTRFLHATLNGDLGGRPPAPDIPTLSESLAPARESPASLLGYEALVEGRGRAADEEDFPPCQVRRGPGDGCAPALHALDEAATANAGIGHFPAGGGSVEGALAPLRDLLASRLDPGAAVAVAPRHWSPRAESFYAARGEAGQRRRQAAALHPVLAPMIAHVPALADLVDAGRPHEAEAVRILGSAMPGAPRLPPALGRRLRGMPGDVSWGTLCELVGLGIAMPLDWLPADEPGWMRLLAVGRGLGRFVDALGLAPAEFLRDASRWWRSAPEGEPFDPGPWHDALDGARDMARRAAETLVEPALGLPPGAEATRRAGRLLFGGLASAGIIARSRAWHDDLPRFERILPGPTDGTRRWPAAFRPFRAPNGLVIEVLDDRDMLVDEGAHGRDAAGARGLGHCVGGYARDCVMGLAHVASVRRHDAGRYERLSTVDLAPAKGGLRVRQHLGRRNAQPPLEATEALDALMEAIASGAHPLSEVALAPRRPSAGAVERGTPEAMREALAAWRPHLPRAAPREDPGAFAAWLAGRGGPAGRGAA